MCIWGTGANTLRIISMLRTVVIVVERDMRLVCLVGDSEEKVVRGWLYRCARQKNNNNLRLGL